MKSPKARTNQTNCGDASAALEKAQQRLRAAVGDSPLWRLRRQVILRTGKDFMAVGNVLSRPFEADKETEDEINAVGLLSQMAGELAVAAGECYQIGNIMLVPRLFVS